VSSKPEWASMIVTSPEVTSVCVVVASSQDDNSLYSPASVGARRPAPSLGRPPLSLHRCNSPQSCLLSQLFRDFGSCGISRPMLPWQFKLGAIVFGCHCRTVKFAVRSTARSLYAQPYCISLIVFLNSRTWLIMLVQYTFSNLRRRKGARPRT
jgi:hypothetical protein